MSCVRRFLVALGALASLGACSGGSAHREGASDSPPTAPPPVPELRLLLLSDPAGVLEPCGCTSRPLGGVDRLVAQVARLEADRVPTVLLAAGDLFTGAPEEAKASPPGAEHEPYLRRLARWRRDTFARALAKAGLRAASWGPSDTVLEASERDALARAVGGALLDPSLQDAVLRVGSSRLGVLAVGEGASLQEVASRAEVLRGRGAQVVVGLVVAPRPRLARRVAALRGVDIALAAGMHARRPLPPDEVAGGLLIHGGRHLQGIAVVELYGLGGHGEWTDHGPWRRRVRIEQLERRIADLEGRLRTWAEEGRPEAQLRPQRARLERLRAELDATKRAEASPSKPRGRWAASRWVELGPEVASDAATRRLLDGLARRINEANRKAFAGWKPQQPSAGQPAYVGSGRCESCHAAAHRWWRATPHGRAYATLRTRHKEFHLECVGCHVTGYGEPGGSTVTHVDGLQDVGCEVCHGPGERHVQAPSRWAPVRRREVPEAVCVGCHNEEHSDRFDYRSYLARLRAPGHGLPLASEDR